VANENTSIDPDALLKFIRTKLADYKVPRKIILATALPRNTTGKILKTVLRQQQTVSE
jgi:acyl-CoA synthetase (AMP-forming)/AMP-acid ligase II